MQAIDLLRHSLNLSDRMTTALIEDMRNAPLTSPTPNGGNHPLWVIGHLAVVEGSIMGLLLGEPNPVARWEPLFNFNTEPSQDISIYPPFEEIVATYRKLRSRNLELLETFGNDRLNEPTKIVPPGLEAVVGTVGKAFMLLALHQMNHRGQVADARRAAGRTPLFVPGESTI